MAPDHAIPPPCTAGARYLPASARRTSSKKLKTNVTCVNPPVGASLFACSTTNRLPSAVTSYHEASGKGRDGHLEQQLGLQP